MPQGAYDQGWSSGRHANVSHEAGNCSRRNRAVDRDWCVRFGLLLADAGYGLSQLSPRDYLAAASLGRKTVV